jgi:AcrR family transcriptional regulator
VSARREELLRVGLELFSTHAFDEISMDDVAAEAGVAKGLLYYYFGSKRGLYVQAVRAAAAEMRERWDEDAEEDPARRLAAGVEAYLGYAEAHSAGYRALIAGGIGTDPEVRGVLAEERELVVRRVVEALELEQPSPALRVAVQGWLSFMEGATLEWLDGGQLGRGELRDLVLGALAGALATARELDPSIPAFLPLPGGERTQA